MLATRLQMRERHLASKAVIRVLSGIQPSGELHIGNYLGAIRAWVHDQYEFDSFFTIVDLHAITVEHSPEELRDNTLQLAMTLLAAGLDPEVCTIFAQSHVSAHAELSWLLECTATFGELSRMTQFKDKGKNDESIRAGLFTYPALMAADILLYQAERVPVGEDQRQHLELTRNVATRFNTKYGETFTIPQATIAPLGSRIMDLAHPDKKMSKSSQSPAGTLFILDPPEVISRKVSRAVTDTESVVKFDPENKPGVSNLIELYCAATGDEPSELVSRHSMYGQLKKTVADALIALLEPLQQRYEEFAKDPGEVSLKIRLTS
ncbi:MAG: tryptophan--tRNA ligase, partial [Actinomycetota bacterium]